MTGHHWQPDWIIFGIQVDEGVCLYASKTLSRVEIEHQFDDDLFFAGRFDAGIRSRGPSYIEVSAVMRDYVWIKAPNYATAFTQLNDLFNQWSQEYAPQPRRLEVVPELTSGPPELMPGGGHA